MRKTVTMLIMLGRLLGVVQILGGVAIWIGLPPWAVQAHMAIGSLFVLVLWIIGVIGLFALSARGLALFTLIWGAFVLWLGMAQTSLLPGTTHWVIRVLHLVVGLAALCLLERLGKMLRARGSEV